MLLRTAHLPVHQPSAPRRRSRPACWPRWLACCWHGCGRSWRCAACGSLKLLPQQTNQKHPSSRRCPALARRCHRRRGGRRGGRAVLRPHLQRVAVCHKGGAHELPCCARCSWRVAGAGGAPPGPDVFHRAGGVLSGFHCSQFCPSLLSQAEALLRFAGIPYSKLVVSDAVVVSMAGRERGAAQAAGGVAARTGATASCCHHMHLLCARHLITPLQPSRRPPRATLHLVLLMPPRCPKDCRPSLSASARSTPCHLPSSG